jgi:hypothetical protein
MAGERSVVAESGLPGVILENLLRPFNSQLDLETPTTGTGAKYLFS